MWCRAYLREYPTIQFIIIPVLWKAPRVKASTSLLQKPALTWCLKRICISRFCGLSTHRFLKAAEEYRSGQQAQDRGLCFSKSFHLWNKIPQRRNRYGFIFIIRISIFYRSDNPCIVISLDHRFSYLLYSIIPIIRLSMQIRNLNNKDFIFPYLIYYSIREPSDLASPGSFWARMPCFRKRSYSIKAI